MISWTIHGNSVYLKHNYHELITNYHQLNLFSYLLMSYCVQKYTFCTEIEVRNIEKRLFPPSESMQNGFFSLRSIIFCDLIRNFATINLQ